MRLFGRRAKDDDRLRPIYWARRASFAARLGMLVAVVVVGLLGTSISLAAAHKTRVAMSEATVEVDIPIERVTESGGRRSLISDRITVKLPDRNGDRRLRSFSVSYR